MRARRIWSFSTKRYRRNQGCNAFLHSQAQKFNNLTDDDDELEEDNLLDTAIERLEPYGMLKGALMRMSFSCCQPS